MLPLLLNFEIREIQGQEIRFRQPRTNIRLGEFVIQENS